jgi:uncharacterized protein DUF1566/carboxypeptidase family protein/SdrD B-like protein
MSGVRRLAMLGGVEDPVRGAATARWPDRARGAAWRRRSLALAALAGVMGLIACSGGGSGGTTQITYGIAGTVGGEVASGVTVVLSGASSGTTTTDGSGHYAFTGLTSGSYTVTPTLAGYAFSPTSLTPTVSGADVTGQDFTATATIPATHGISGTVGGAIASGVTVTLSGAGSGTTTTDGSGHYAFTGLTSGSYTVTPTLAGYAFSPTSLTPTVSGADVTGQDFTATATIPATHGISGTVGGAIASGVTVTLSGAGSGTTTTDGSGHYAFTGLTDGSYTVRSTLAGYAFSPTSLTPTVSGADVTGQDFTATATIPATHGISGTVGGAIASGVTVTLSGAGSGTTTTDGSGHYAFTGLTDGSYTVRSTLAGYAFSPTSLTPTVSGADVTGQDFTALAKIHIISGAVSGAGSVRVSLTGAASASATTDASGAFAFTGLANGAYTLTPSKQGYTFAPASLSVVVSDADVTGQDFTASALPFVVSGHVSGAPAVALSLTGAATATTTIDASGDYLLPGLSNGSYVVTPYKDSEFTFLPVSRSVTIASADQGGQDFTALDAMWANWTIPAVSPATSDYSIGTDTVLDNVTGLLWQRTVTKSLAWDNAKTYCRSLSLGGLSSGWRLPTLIELESIVDYGAFGPAINVTAFPGTASDYFWAAAPYVDNVSFAVMVDFGAGYLAGGIKSTTRLVRCVR